MNPPAPPSARIVWAEQPALRGATVRVANVPLKTPHATASGLLASAPMVLLDLHGDDGSTGSAYLFTISIAFAPAVARLLRDMLPWLVGGSAAAPAIQAELVKRTRLIGPHGFTMMAMSAFDMAAWDLACRRAGLTLHAALGAKAEACRPYAPVGMAGAAAAAAEARAWVDAGFGGVKARLGYATLEEDLSVVRAIRQAVGTDTALMVDYNQALDEAEALRRCRALDDERIAWIEEPTIAADFAAHARIAAAVATPIQAGENWWGPLEFAKAFDAHASDLVMPDLMRIGGVSAWQPIAALAAERGIALSNHLFPEASAHLMAATPGRGWFEWTDWTSPAIAEPPALREGLLWPSAAPGIGVRWNEAVLQSCGVRDG